MSVPAPGSVLERRVEEGATVTRGQVLFVLDTGRMGPQGEVSALVEQTLQQGEATLRTELTLRAAHARQRRQTLHDRLHAMSDETAPLQAEAALARRRVELAERRAERYRQPASSGFVSELQAQSRQERLLDLHARAQAAERAVAVLARERHALQAKAEALEHQWATERTQVERALVQLGQERRENDARRQLLVTASVAGVASAVHAPMGSTLQAGQNLLTLVPGGPGQTQAGPGEGALEAELYAPSRTAGLVMPGRRAWLRIAAFPYQKFGLASGTVVAVSRTPVSPQDLPAGQLQALLAAAQSAEPLYRIRVKLHAQHLPSGPYLPPLRPGMALEADCCRTVAPSGSGC